MTDPLIYLSFSLTGLAGIAMLSATALHGWRGWLDLKRFEVQQAHHDNAAPSAGSRIEMADLKERIRKLEAIAAGVDL